MENGDIFFSILGIDGYIANWGVQTFFLVGEWFLGYIIIIYIIFPILRKGVNEYPLLLAIITAVLYILSIVLGAKDVSLFVKLPGIPFWNVFYKVYKKAKFENGFDFPCYCCY